MSDKAHLVVVPASTNYVFAVDEKRYIVKAGAPDWVDDGDWYSFKIVLACVATLFFGFSVLDGLLSLQNAGRVVWWLWAFYGGSVPALPLCAAYLLTHKRNFKKWTLQLKSETAVRLVDSVAELDTLARKYDLEEGLVKGWESRIIEAATVIDPLAIEIDNLRKERVEARRNKDHKVYASALSDRIGELQKQVDPVLGAAKELVSQVTQLGYAKKAVELKGLSLPVSPAQVTALSLLDEVERVKSLTAAYTQLAALSENSLGSVELSENKGDKSE